MKNKHFILISFVFSFVFFYLNNDKPNKILLILGIIFLIIPVYLIFKKPFNRILRNFGWIEITSPPGWINKKVRKECKKGKGWVSGRIFYFRGKHRIYKVVFGIPQQQGDDPSETYYYKNRK